MRSRRRFIKMLGAIGGTILAPIHLVERVSASPTPAEALPAEAEVYGGFVLLTEGLPLPQIVTPPRVGVPIMCGVGNGDGRAHPQPNAVTQLFTTTEDLAKKAEFPVYALNKPPAGSRLAGGYIIGHDTGETYAVSLGYEIQDRETGNWEPVVSLWAQPDFARPYPLWSSPPLELGHPGIVLEKVDVLPVPGILAVTSVEHIYHWIETDVLYMLVIKQASLTEPIQTVLNSLARI